MTDREMLELAARAAGMKVDFTAGGKIVWDVSSEQHRIWNPLTNDGHALQLAVMLRFCVSANFDGICVSRSMNEPLAWEGTGIGSDEIRCMRATRRAIVRAAAEIGRSMDAPSA